LHGPLAFLRTAAGCAGYQNVEIATVSRRGGENQRE